MEKSSERLKVIEKINEYERMGKFNDDVEEDLPSEPITPKQVDYTNRKIRSKVLTKVANFLGKTFFEHLIKKQKFIIKEIDGLENVSAVKGGAIITCNHFNLRDNYAVYKAIKPVLQRRRKRLYKVIKEGNYTNFHGPVRLMMRHANTLPLSSDMRTMRKFYRAVEKLLKRGEKILIYPEQAMWWNYRKPRPFKNGAFKLAVKNNVPVLPVFITMKDSEVLDDDGFFVQEYYIHFLPAIFPDESLVSVENVKEMAKKNYNLWVKTYEEFYQEKLEYSSANKKDMSI